MDRQLLASVAFVVLLGAPAMAPAANTGADRASAATMCCASLALPESARRSAMIIWAP